MALDRFAKLELGIRTAFRSFYLEKLSTPKQPALILPGFDVPRAGPVELILAPKAGTFFCFVQRSDFVAAYKHTVGQLVGTLTHFHRMKERELRDALRAVEEHPDLVELKQGKLDPLNLSKRLCDDRKEGAITLALAVERPDVPQQAKELDASFVPIGKFLQAVLVVPIRKKRLCEAVEFFAADLNADPPAIKPLSDALKPMLDPTS